ncbi:hypothetical protein C2E21_4501 [Chlorella sorokiniana]|uniref:Uncharacterized protein n=1 Tax=Chlorella sorokiniana TaxID=3076 RepID=A0A2P6TRB2_CHLSO|nr:hypothetical protein C2E21_4501 [Chlorella sorokiniana]|eukprot:PRW56599.1 hypothetical protein C2E21_4501 [Chlorella sorokiniana]
MAKGPELADWPTGLCDCFSDSDICVQGLLPCVLFDKNASKLGVLQDDNPCGQFCMMCTCAYGLCGLLGMGCAAVCASNHLFQVRDALRKRAGLKAAPCNDCLVVYCCGPCAACQEARVLKAMETEQAMHAAPSAQLMGKDADAAPALSGHMAELTDAFLMSLAVASAQRGSLAAQPCFTVRQQRIGSHRSAPARWQALVLAAAAPERAAAAPPAEQQAAQLLALKEWAPTCAAIAAGEQTILLRKGGIKEPTFTPAARQFLLFPTAFHTDAELLKPAAAQRYAAEVQYDPKQQAQLSLGTFCTITGAWTTHDTSVLELLDELHCWAPAFLDARLKWRGKQPVTVLELRASRLEAPLITPPREEFFGCFSWCDLSSGQGGAAADPSQQQQKQQQGWTAAALAAAPGTLALDDAAWAQRQQLCRQQLAKLADCQELVF